MRLNERALKRRMSSFIKFDDDKVDTTGVVDLRGKKESLAETIMRRLRLRKR